MTITNATLHNEIQVLAKDVRVGDTVIVRRAGDVIPEVVGSVKEQRPKGAKAWRMPAACPACGQPLVRPEGEGHHFCENVDCPSRIEPVADPPGLAGRARHRGARREDRHASSASSDG